MPLGAHLSPEDKRDILFASVVPEAQASALPAVFSLRDKQSPVAFQSYGTCEGFTGKDLIEYQRPGLKASGRGIYIIAKQNDGLPADVEGTYTRNLMQGLQGIGAPFLADISDDDTGSYATYIKGLSEEAIQNADQNRIGGYAKIVSIADIKNAINLLHGCPIMIPVFEDYLSTDNKGLIQKPVGNLVGYHEVLAIGWNNDGVEIKNHWGTGWGDKGFGFVPYSYSYGLCFVESFAAVDFINSDTKGAPVNLSYPTKVPYVTQGFGERPEYYAQYGLAGHEGIDFRAATGTEIFACDDGEIIFSGLNGGYGKCIKIQHAWGISLYAHLNDYVVIDTDRPTVKKGQLIAHSDSTGDSDAPHLHFGIKINGISNPKFKDWVDPKGYFGMSNSYLIELVKKDGTKEFAIAMPAVDGPALIDKGLNTGVVIPTTADGKQVDWPKLVPKYTITE